VVIDIDLITVSVDILTQNINVDTKVLETHFGGSGCQTRDVLWTSLIGLGLGPLTPSWTKIANLGEGQTIGFRGGEHPCLTGRRITYLVNLTFLVKVIQ